MDELESQKSSDSTGTAEEYVVIEEGSALVSEPSLKIANNGNIEDLTEELSEVMKEKGSSSASPSGADSINEPMSNSSYCGTGERNPNFKFASKNDIDDNYTIFNRILYLGAASINAPHSEAEIQHNMYVLNGQPQEQEIEVSVSVPSNSEGYVIIYDAGNNTEIMRFEIHCILFCAKGQIETSEASCFAFTASHGDTRENTIYRCHVFRCQIPEAVSRVVVSFVTAFHRTPKTTYKKENFIKSEYLEHHFDITLEIKEEDYKGNFTTVPRDKEFFKLRSNIQKQLIFTVAPTNTKTSETCSLDIERCFGILIASGRRVKHADMNLIGMETMGNIVDKKTYSVTGLWNPKEQPYIVLNRETPKDLRVFMTVAIDLVIKGIQEPIRFIIETKVRIYSQNERFWYFSKTPLTHLFSLKLKQVENTSDGENQFIVVSVDNLGEVERYRPPSMSLALNLSSLTSSTFSSFGSGRSPSVTSIDTPGGEEDSDDDEPLLSGSGEVSKDCSEGELELWHQVLPKWQASPHQPLPKVVSKLVKSGIPETLRGEVWLLLAGCTEAQDMMETYRVLLAKECSSDQVIQRDISRTFPAHDYFKEAGGVGQDALYKISKAYAVYDEEVGYCQGLSFLAAALLLHMPEEQTFCVIVKVMFEYGLRDLFRDNFEMLHMRFYQLDRMMEENTPDLWNHFHAQGIESHMFASQWFLTLYTAKFPLFMVFHYIDMFLLLGMDSVFQVALALLQLSKKELLASDFEGILKYFRVSLPKKYRSEEAARQLFRVATSRKVRKLKKYEKEYFAIKEQEALQEDPVVRLEKENRRLLEDNMRLERELDDLAHELGTSKISMRHHIDKLEDKCDTITKEVAHLKTELLESEEQKSRLQEEVEQIKELLKREVEKGDLETSRNASIINEYKQICSQLSERLEKEQTANKLAINSLKNKVSACDTCKRIVSPTSSVSGSLTDEESNPIVQALQVHVRDLELELAQTKLALVESECQNQDLNHQLNIAVAELQASRNSRSARTLFSSLKERGSSSLLMMQTNEM